MGFGGAQGLLRKHAYTICGTAVTAIAALITAPYWALDVAALTFSSLTIVQYCLRKLELPSWFRLGRPPIRSRVFTYSQVVRQVKKGSQRNFILRTDGSFFLSNKPLSLSKDEFAELESEMNAVE
jgi:hypothetical protein